MRIGALFGRAREAEAADARVYAIGDIHGRLDLLGQLIALIEADLAERPTPHARIVVLGDFIDRGPDSAKLIALFRQCDGAPGITVLKGNHEASMVAALRGDYDALEGWLSQGGRDAAQSFGVPAAALEDGMPRDMLRTLRAHIDGGIVDWLDALPTWHRSGGYYFVHAGVRPGRPLAAQTDDDRLWIRGAFTASDADHGAVVVHGHSVTHGGVHIGANRIGVDTGAWATGRLSAAVLEGNDVRVLSTGSETLQ